MLKIYIRERRLLKHKRFSTFSIIVSAVSKIRLTGQTPTPLYNLTPQLSPPPKKKKTLWHACAPLYSRPNYPDPVYNGVYSSASGIPRGVIKVKQTACMFYASLSRQTTLPLPLAPCRLPASPGSFLQIHSLRSLCYSTC